MTMHVLAEHSVTLSTIIMPVTAGEGLQIPFDVARRMLAYEQILLYDS